MGFKNPTQFYPAIARVIESSSHLERSFKSSTAHLLLDYIYACLQSSDILILTPDHEVYCTSAAVVYLPSISHSSGRRYDFWASRCQWRLGNHISGVVPVQLQQFVTSTTSGEIARVMSRTAGTEETFKLD